MSELFRDHVQYHERRLEQQQLDALLRIEELLIRHFDGDKDRPPVSGPGIDWAHPVKDEVIAKNGIVKVKRK